jgi:hypothetical protein
VSTTFYAGQRVTAADLAGALPLLGWVKTDVSKISSTTLADATGLAVTLAASATYAIDAYLAYVAVEAADIKISLSAPEGSTGHWGLRPGHQLGQSHVDQSRVVDSRPSPGLIAPHHRKASL